MDLCNLLETTLRLVSATCLCTAILMAVGQYKRRNVWSH